MKNLESLKKEARDLLSKEPIWEKAFPPEPWDESHLVEIAYTVRTLLLTKNEVTNDDPWEDWLDKWDFYKHAK